LHQNKNYISESHQVDIGGRLKGRPFTVRALTYDEYNRIQQEAATVSTKGRIRVDGGRIFEQIALACCLDPDFSNSDFITENNCLTPKQLLHSLLLPGEIVDLAKKIQEYSGFDQDFEELVTEAKN